MFKSKKEKQEEMRQRVEEHNKQVDAANDKSRARVNLELARMLPKKHLVTFKNGACGYYTNQPRVVVCDAIFDTKLERQALSLSVGAIVHSLKQYRAGYGVDIRDAIKERLIYLDDGVEYVTSEIFSIQELPEALCP